MHSTVNNSAVTTVVRTDTCGTATIKSQESKQNEAQSARTESSLCTLCLHACQVREVMYLVFSVCQVRVTVGDLGLCCLFVLCISSANQLPHVWILSESRLRAKHEIYARFYGNLCRAERSGPCAVFYHALWRVESSRSLSSILTSPRKQPGNMLPSTSRDTLESSCHSDTLKQT